MKRPVHTSRPSGAGAAAAKAAGAGLDSGAGTPGRAPLAVVGIGASAGGLRALQLFFEAVPPGSGMAWVVIMHLDPDRESRIAALLQGRTSLPVTQVTAPAAVEAGHVYIISPGQDLVMEGQTIGVRERGAGPHAPVDLFFGTLAAACGADAVGVVLSGTGADGTAGVRAIREGGGITLAQEPAEAEYDGMPASAIATGHVDLVLPAGHIPAEIVRLRQSTPALSAHAPAAGTEALLAQVFAVLRARTGHDFSQYKRSTVLRRLDRRLRFNRVGTLEEYLPLLRAGEAEPAALVRDLLISVSAFFRDEEAFAALARAIPQLFEGKAAGDAVRVWVVGCATGEEAYSIGILLREHAATLESPPQIQMFATDIDEKGYAWGREALYPPEAVAGISPERLRRFFTREAGGFRVGKALREGVLFAVHNVLHNPPFSRLDLISCRNLLIYLQPAAQERVVETFHYALRPGGLLFLGASESAGESGLFAPADGPRRLYRRNAAPPRVPPRLSAADPKAPPAPHPAGGRRRAPFAYGPLHLRLLEAYAPASLVVNERLEVVHLSGGAGRYLHLGAGEPTTDLVALTRGELRTELRAALYQAFEKGLPTTRVVAGGGEPALRLRVRPPVEGEGAERFALVVLEEAEAAAPSPDRVGGDDPGAADGLGGELRRLREQLEHAGEARDHTVEELQAANEELRSVNEEQKAAGEELETSREEIQSINEELITINQERQNTIDELKRANADLQNLIESSEIATIFLDRELRVRRFTPSSAALFNFVAGDQGRPLAHITHRLRYPELGDDARRVLASLERSEREVESDDGSWFIVRINPYRSPDDGVDGAVVTCFDVTAQKRVEEALRETTIAAESANLAKGTFLATLSHEFRTPLNGMLGYADLLHLDGPLNAAQTRKVERIKAGGWHLAAMIDEILAFALRDEGRDRVRAERLDARAIARAAGELVEPAAQAKGLAFAVDVPAREVAVETDGGKARQILINLCGNAVKYTERGEVRLGLREEGGHVVFEVRDTGIGIAPEHQARVFDRFWQVDSASTRSAGGMGIGLAAAREFSRLLGGEVEVESEPGRGSTFRVRLPRTRGDG
ncbi:MAG TPA: chemotaxis protein CheB [Longimicrobium sp.]|nr:chemotaxis protein CheB [Longimicrobium sp.]